ncbi:tRNA uridine-5-carboxymethylaminomethyl(34) synthesis enzyme MnmG [bacterium]|nr:tRNA uridine-5-carboxymethylaminomethyl(34) synthesis enzyme MnmG [candidate division CSSED10-310 bacterium]
MSRNVKYDVVVAGAGHAGIEASMACARMGLNTALITLNVEMIGHMPCNPAVGGLGKSQIVREIDALGGWIGRLADATGIQFRMLNRKKGPAVWSLRTQNDKAAYRRAAQKLVFNQPKLDVLQDEITAIQIKNRQCTGIVTSLGETIQARIVVLTPGTFMNGRIFIGLHSQEAGRLGEFPARGLSQSLLNAGLTLGRLKTGTPCRIDGRTIDLSGLEAQPGDADHPYFSHWGEPIDSLPQIECYLTYTNRLTHELIRNSLDRSPLYTGKITGIGPRYCPSIEDKVMRFPDRDQHQIFLEPEGLDSKEIYANGISTSLPYDVQAAMLQSIRGLENARMIRPAYAVEYDFVQPTQLKPSLECREIDNLFLAGQINGTSGYEEAAGQGLLAGINAFRKLHEQNPLILTRDQAYIGVMIDDLVTRGVDEPYRMFTSRAEYRLLLRSDNADTRLVKTGFDSGLIESDRYDLFQRRNRLLNDELKRLETQRLSPTKDNLALMEKLSLQGIHRHMTLKELLRRPEFSYSHLIEFGLDNPGFPSDLIEKLMIEIRYEGYIERQVEDVSRFRKLEDTIIPANFDYLSVDSLSNEVRQKLNAIRPVSLGQASRIPGMTPAAISVLSVLIHRAQIRRGSSGAQEKQDAALDQ